MPMSVSHKQRETEACRNSSCLSLQRSTVAVLHHIPYDREFDFYQCLNIQETLILLNRSRIQELSKETCKKKKCTASSHKEKALAFFSLWICCGEWEPSPFYPNHRQERFNRIVIICVGIVKLPRHIVYVKT